MNESSASLARPLFPSLLLLTLAACGGGGGGGSGAPAARLAFSAPQYFATGGATACALADVDGDGRADALVVDPANGRLTVLRGELASFAAPVSIPVGFAVNLLAVGDFNGDHHVDVVVASTQTAGFAMLRNDGAGGFVLQPFHALAAAATGLGAAEFNLDGKLDLVLSLADRTIAVLTGDGLGGFATPVVTALSSAGGGLALADFDRDGRLDAATTGGNGSELMSLHGSGNGAFSNISINVDAQRGVLAAADVDGDGRLDLVSLSANGRSAVLLHGGAQGTFGAATTIALPEAMVGLRLCDLDGDGLQDLLACGGVQLFAAYGQGAGFGAFESLLAGTSATAAVQAVDVDADGRLDVVWLDASGRLGVLRNPTVMPTGYELYGAGTPDCVGTMPLYGRGKPQVGNLAFAFLTTNAPPRAVGWLLVGGPPSVVGVDPGIGCKVHLEFGGLIEPRLVFADSNGYLLSANPIPARQQIAGLPVSAQVLWLPALGESCSTSPLGMSSTRGFTVTIQP